MLCTSRAIDLERLRFVLFQHGAQALQDIARTRCLRSDLAQKLVELAKVDGLVSREAAARSQRVVLDGDQWLIDLVRDGGGHLAHGVDSRQVRETLAILRRLGLSLALPFGGAVARQQGGQDLADETNPWHQRLGPFTRDADSLERKRAVEHAFHQHRHH